MISIDILSSEETLFSGSAERVIFPAPNGKFEVLENHAPLISRLSKGNITLVFSSSERKEIPIQKGFIKVVQNRIAVVVE